MSSRTRRRLATSDDEEEEATPRAAKPAAARGRRADDGSDEIEPVREGVNGDDVELFDEENSEEATPASRRGKQNGSKRKSQSKDSDIFEPPSKAKKSVELTHQQSEELVGSAVRYVLFCDAVKKPIKRTDLGDKVFGEAHKDKKRQLLPYVLKGAQDKLRTVFGAELIEYRRKDKKKDTLTGTGVYYLQSSVYAEVNPLLAKHTDQSAKAEEFGFLMTVITLIAMSDNKTMPEEKFLDCMKQCTPPLPLEGAMAKFIKEGYILKQKRKEGAGLDYRIGPRALVELKRTSVPEFLGQIFGEQVEANRAKDLEFEEDEAVSDDDEGEPTPSQAPAPQGGASQPSQSQRRR